MAAESTAKLYAARPSKLYTIGQVLSLLQSEFPELTGSKLRFLEEEGLITPERTAANYRKYTEYHIDRIRVILDMQRTQYLPLKVIEQYLNDFEAGKKPAIPTSASIAPAISKLNAKKLSLIELIAETGITDSLISEAQAQNLIGEEPFDLSSVEIARALVNLRRFGISPRHLRGIKASADREIGIIEGVIAPVLGKKETSSKSSAAHYAREMDQQFAAIRASLIQSAIRKIES